MKRFVLIAAVFLVIFSGCGTDSEKKTVSIEELTSFIPEGATGIFTINYRRMKKYGVYKDILKDIKREVELDRSVVNSMGDEFKEELDYIIITTFQKSNKDKLLVLLSGDYENGYPESLMKQGKSSTYKSSEIFSFSQKSTIKDNKLEGYIAKVENNLILMANDLELIKEVIELREKKGSQKNNKEIRKYIKGYNKKRRILSLAWRFPEKYRKLTKDLPFARINLSKAEVIVAKVNYVNNVWDGIIKLVTKDPETNSKIATTLNGIKFMGAMAGPEVEELLKKITLSASDEAVKIHFSASDSLLKELKKKAEKRFGGEEAN